MYGNNYGFNPYYQQQRFQNIEQNQQPLMTTYQQPVQLTKPNNLLGKSVDNIDVVKAMDIPLDGSISYFPLTDGSAIVSKQLQIDGTSKITIYKPIEEKETPKEEIKYITQDELDEYLNKFDFDSINDELKDIKKEIKDIKKEMK